MPDGMDRPRSSTPAGILASGPEQLFKPVPEWRRSFCAGDKMIHPHAIRDERRLKIAVSVNDESTAGSEHHSELARVSALCRPLIADLDLRARTAGHVRADIRTSHPQTRIRSILQPACHGARSRFGFMKVMRQLAVDHGQRFFSHSFFRLPNCASHNSASDLATIAKTSTLVTATS
jgi:hypothetical protein